jgi:MFS family permease
LGIPKEQWWLTFIPLLLTMIVASVPVGKMVDKIGRKIPLLIGLAVFGGATLLFAFGNFLTVIISMVMLGVGQLLAMAAMMALTTDLIEPMNRGKVMGVRNFVGYIFTALGMLLGNYLYIAFTPQMPFYLTLAITIPNILIVLFFIHEHVDSEASANKT